MLSLQIPLTLKYQKWCPYRYLLRNTLTVWRDYHGIYQLSKLKGKIILCKNSVFGGWKQTVEWVRPKTCKGKRPLLSHLWQGGVLSMSRWGKTVGGRELLRWPTMIWGRSLFPFVSSMAVGSAIPVIRNRRGHPTSRIINLVLTRSMVTPYILGWFVQQHFWI